MRDPQMWANKWLSQTLHILNTSAKGGIVAEEDAFADMTEAEEKWAQPCSRPPWTRSQPAAAGRHCWSASWRSASPLPKYVGMRAFPAGACGALRQSNLRPIRTPALYQGRGATVLTDQ